MNIIFGLKHQTMGTIFKGYKMMRKRKNEKHLHTDPYSHTYVITEIVAFASNFLDAAELWKKAKKMVGDHNEILKWIFHITSSLMLLQLHSQKACIRFMKDEKRLTEIQPHCMFSWVNLFRLIQSNATALTLNPKYPGGFFSYGKWWNNQSQYLFFNIYVIYQQLLV